jgi:hypothetical protein
MTPKDTSDGIAGRVKAVFELNIGSESKAVVTTVIARACGRGRDGVQFSGAASFSPKSRRQILDVIVPVTKRILANLRLPKTKFEISVMNLDIASAHDIGLKISGFSADVPVFLAILSAGLQLPVIENAVFTGHIASIDGAIRMVSGLPVKLEAAVRNPLVDTFVCPDISNDRSLNDLTPNEKNRIAGALSQAKRSLNTIPVDDVGDLVRVAFTDERIVKASLTQGFFCDHKQISHDETPIGRATKCLVVRLDQRFWTTVSSYFFQGHSKQASELLSAFINHHDDKKLYPTEVGKNLFQTIASIPPATRRLKIRFPLVSINRCIQLGQFADKSENDDVLLLLKACSGDRSLRFSNSTADKSFLRKQPINHNDKLLEAIHSEIGADNLSSLISSKIDSARSKYVMDSVVVESYEDFNEIITTFYLYMLRYSRTVAEPLDMDWVGAEAFALLERAFARIGGFQAALAESRHATKGGMRYVLDVITDQFKREECEKYIGYVLKLALDPQDRPSKLKLIETLMERLKPHLSPEITAQPAEQFADHVEQIVRAYAQSMDELTSIFRLY